MSPEVNGNPPNITKRKKNREKKATGPEIMHNFDLNMPSCNYFPLNHYPYNNNFPVPEIPNYYSFINCPNQSEPKSLPVYPINYSGGYNNCLMESAGNISRHSMRSNHTFNVHADMPDYTSLPIGNSEENNEESKRPFSDPGLPNESDSGSSLYDENVHKLTKQIQILNENNNKLSREVMELRIELNLLKQQQTNNRHYEREYEPGMLADVIREVRDAARVREDALLARVKHIIEEKQLNVNQLNFVTEKNRNTDRISALEDQLKNLSVSNNNLRSESSINSIHSSTLCLSDDKNNSARQVFQLEREALELRRELEDTRAKKEEADQKLKRYSNMFKRGEISTSDPSEDGKTSVDSISTVTTTSSVATPRIILTGPITSL